MLVTLCQPCPGLGDGIMEALLQQFLGRQFGKVFSHADAGLLQLQQLDPLVRLLRAQNQPDPTGVSSPDWRS